MKTYIGTKDGKRVFIEWELKDGNFSAPAIFSGSGGYWNQAGTDYAICGQVIDQIAKDFPENKQAQEIHMVWVEYHLNHVKAGSPIQEKLIGDKIKPKYDLLKREARNLRTLHNKSRALVSKKVEKAQYHKYQSVSNITDDIIDWANKNVNPDTQLKPKTFYIGPKGICANAFGMGYSTVYLDPTTQKNLLTPPKLPDWFDFVRAELAKVGRLIDPDFIYKGRAYKYGSAWLKKEIPPKVIKQIKSWEEMPAPDEPTPIETFCAKLDVSITGKGLTKRDDWECRKWVVMINGEKFHYYTGMGINGKPEPKAVLPALLSDAYIGSNGLDDAVASCVDIGFEGKKLVEVARECVKTFERLSAIGAYDDNLAMHI